MKVREQFLLRNRGPRDWPRTQPSCLAALKEQQLRAREAELAQALVTEQGRWSDLINRLEQMIKR